MKRYKIDLYFEDELLHKTDAVFESKYDAADYGLNVIWAYRHFDEILEIVNNSSVTYDPDATMSFEVKEVEV